MTADSLSRNSTLGPPVRVESTVRRHSSIPFDPQLAMDDRLGYPPRTEQ
ncbi:hypothetical protein [Nocardia sp. NPDC057030]